MKYLPFENITLHTQLSVEEVIERLSENLEPREIFPFMLNRDRKTYEGYIKHNQFNINKVIQGRDSFRPMIKGELQENEAGTTIEIKMRFHIFIFIFITIWCSIALMFGLLFGFTKEIFSSLGIIAFLYGLGILSFKRQSIHTKKHLAQLFEAEIESTYNRRNPQNKQYKK